MKKYHFRVAYLCYAEIKHSDWLSCDELWPFRGLYSVYLRCSKICLLHLVWVLPTLPSRLIVLSVILALPFVWIFVWICPASLDDPLAGAEQKGRQSKKQHWYANSTNRFSEKIFIFSWKYWATKPLRVRMVKIYSLSVRRRWQLNLIAKYTKFDCFVDRKQISQSKFWKVFRKANWIS